MQRVIIGIISVVFLLAGCAEEKTSSELPDEDFLIIAHRGASAYVPENTLASYELAEEMNADYVELDIHLTKDDEIVVMHDEDVSKTTEESGDIGNYTLAELKELSANFRYEEEGNKAENGPAEAHEVPTLQEVFDEFGESMNFMVELKEPETSHGIEEKLVDFLKENEMINTVKDGHPKVVVHSFYEKRLKQVHELNKDIPLLKLVTFEKGEIKELSNKEIEELLTYSSAIGVGYDLLDEDFIKKMHRKGLSVYATAVQDAEAASDMKEIGTKGIFTDRPDLLEEKSK